MLALADDAARSLGDRRHPHPHISTRSMAAQTSKELAAARAELHRLRATQRDPDATLN
jgi:hypothetical protein